MPVNTQPLTACTGERLRASRLSGFTLTELTVVLVIVALLLGGLLVPLSSQIDIRNINDNRQAMAEIREALLGFALVNRYFPCPALPNVASGNWDDDDQDAGVEKRTEAGACTLQAGVLPWATLGVPETDPWGRRYGYRVTPAFSKSPPLPPFTLDSTGDMVIRPFADSTGGNAKLADNVPVVVVSYGRNGNGAYTPQGTALPRGTDADEMENQVLFTTGVWADSPVVKEFVKRSAPTATYDDEVVWISPGVLFNRMVAAGKLP